MYLIEYLISKPPLFLSSFRRICVSVLTLRRILVSAFLFVFMYYFYLSVVGVMTSISFEVDRKLWVIPLFLCRHVIFFVLYISAEDYDFFGKSTHVICYYFFYYKCLFILLYLTSSEVDYHFAYENMQLYFSSNTKVPILGLISCL